MARTVSRSEDVNGKSVSVPVAELDGSFEDHIANPQDVVAAKTPLPNSFKGMQEIATNGWIENLMNSTTVFTDGKGNSFKLQANGIHGSIQPIDEVLRKNAYLLRAVQRDKIRFLSEDEAADRINDLVDEVSSHEDHYSHLMESLGENASENNGFYKPGVPDEAEPNGPAQTVEQIWAKSKNKPESPKNFERHVKSGESEFTL